MSFNSSHLTGQKTQQKLLFDQLQTQIYANVAHVYSAQWTILKKIFGHTVYISRLFHYILGGLNLVVGKRIKSPKKNLSASRICLPENA